MNLEDKEIEITGDVTTITATEVVEQPASQTYNDVLQRIMDLENQQRVIEAQEISIEESLAKLYPLRDSLAPIVEPEAE